MKFKKHNQMLEHKLAWFAAVAALCTLLTLTYQANSHTPEVEIHTGQKLCHFGHYVANVRSYFVLKVLSRLPGVPGWKYFHPCYGGLSNRARFSKAPETFQPVK